MENRRLDSPHPIPILRVMRHTILIPDETRARLAGYLASLRSGAVYAGERLKQNLRRSDPAALTEAAFLDVLINTKVPQIFAESAVAGDGSDWNLTELGILGDISIAVPVTVFDYGNHTTPVAHTEPFPGTLIFTPGALLQNGRGKIPADLMEVTRPDGTLSPDGYFRLYERRLLPVFRHADACAAAQGKTALLTIPGLGCGSSTSAVLAPTSCSAVPPSSAVVTVQLVPLKLAYCRIVFVPVWVR